MLSLEFSHPTPILLPITPFSFLLRVCAPLPLIVFTLLPLLPLVTTRTACLLRPNSDAHSSHRTRGPIWRCMPGDEIPLVRLLAFTLPRNLLTVSSSP
ncbi:hypothetical protein B0H13DRAFT_2312257 [Mycena leptocephala]|nr:hypothetical protein B0H13DRAFT_2312257 [Mycena leptocephala]